MRENWSSKKERGLIELPRDFKSKEAIVRLNLQRPGLIEFPIGEETSPILL